MHPDLEECSSGDYFSVGKSSWFREMLSQGLFSTAECILIQRNALSGMIFHSRNHPDSKDSSLRDDFQRRGASCFERMLFQGLFFSWKIILIQRNALSGMIFNHRNHPDLEECSSGDYFSVGKSSWYRGILSQGLFSTAEIILIQRNPLPGIIFNGRNHPDSEKSSLRDASMMKKLSHKAQEALSFS